MGIFNKIKNIFNTSKNDPELEKYDEGLEKSRKYFSNKINILNSKYKKVSDAYFEELEEILIMADIGVNTVMDFIDKLKNTNLDLIFLDEKFSSHDKGYRIKNDSHPSAKANKEIAEILYNHINEGL